MRERRGPGLPPMHLRSGGGLLLPPGTPVSVGQRGVAARMLHWSRQESCWDLSQAIGGMSNAFCCAACGLLRSAARRYALPPDKQQAVARETRKARAAGPHQESGAGGGTGCSILPASATISAAGSQRGVHTASKLASPQESEQGSMQGSTQGSRAQDSQTLNGAAPACPPSSFPPRRCGARWPSGWASSA